MYSWGNLIFFHTIFFRKDYLSLRALRDWTVRTDTPCDAQLLNRHLVLWALSIPWALLLSTGACSMLLLGYFSAYSSVQLFYISTRTAYSLASSTCRLPLLPKPWSYLHEVVPLSCTHPLKSHSLSVNLSSKNRKPSYYLVFDFTSASGTSPWIPICNGLGTIVLFANGGGGSSAHCVIPDEVKNISTPKPVLHSPSILRIAGNIFITSPFRPCQNE